MLRSLLVLSAMCATAFCERPFTPQIDPSKIADPALYQSIQTPDDDPTLAPNQRRAIVYSRPVWYPDKTGKLLPIDTTLRETVDLETLEVAYGNASNTLAFKAGEDGSALYVCGGHQLRVALVETTSDTDNKEFGTLVEKAERPWAFDVRGSNVAMGGILSDVAVEHVVQPGRVKEYLTISRGPVAASVTTVRYTWECQSDLTPVERNGAIDWCDGTETVFTFDPPVAHDAAGRAIPCEYELRGNRVSIVFDALPLRKAQFPIVVDPTVTTNASTECYNRSTGDSEDSSWNYAFAEFAMPNLTGFTSIDSAAFLPTVSVSNTPEPTVDVACDVVSLWTESSSAATLAALSFNAATDTAVDSVQDNTPIFDILGSSGTNGIAKIYADDPSPAYGTVRLDYNGGTEINDMVGTILRIGIDQEGNGPVYYTHTDATNYWRVEIVYTIARKRSGGSAGIIGP